MSAAADPRQRWLHGPASDLLLGCGLGYALVALLFAVPAVEMGVEPWIFLGASLIGHLTNTPHYGATILRVYESGEDRRRYTFFAVHASVALALLCIAGLHVAALGSILITVYVTWSPWHFAGQNYGLALMFLRRRGVAVDSTLKRLLYSSFLLSFVLAILILHRESGAISLAPVPELGLGAYRFIALGLPAAFANPAFVAVGAAYLGVLALAFVRLRREATLGDLVPAIALVATQAVWFSIPALLRFRGSFTPGNIVLTAFGIAVGHSLQYLWVTSYYAKQGERRERLGPYLGKTLLAGWAVVIFPTLLFAPALLGTVPFNAGLSALVFSVVNLHHFVLDGAIWKLRDGRVARILLRAPEAAPAGPRAGRRGWLRPLLGAAGAVSFGVAAVYAWELEFGVTRPRAVEDLARMELAAQRLDRIGREDHDLHRELGEIMARRTWSEARERGLPVAQANFEGAEHHYRRSLAIYPSAEAWLGLGNLRLALGNRAAAHEAYDAALALQPRHARTLNRLGELWLAEGELARARAALDRAARLAPRDKRIRSALAKLAEAEGRKGRGPATRSAP